MTNYKKWLLCAFLFLICFLILRYINSLNFKESFNTGPLSLLALWGYNNGRGFSGYNPGQRGYVSRFGYNNYGPKWNN